MILITKCFYGKTNRTVLSPILKNLQNKRQKFSQQFAPINKLLKYIPLAVRRLVLMILAANSSPVSILQAFRTTLKAPLVNEEDLCHVVVHAFNATSYFPRSSVTLYRSEKFFSSVILLSCSPPQKRARRTDQWLPVAVRGRSAGSLLYSFGQLEAWVESLIT